MTKGVAHDKSTFCRIVQVWSQSLARCMMNQVSATLVSSFRKPKHILVKHMSPRHNHTRRVQESQAQGANRI